MSFERRLARALGDAGPSRLSPETLSRLAALDRFLTQWSRRLDLIGFRTKDERVRRYFAEPIAAVSSLPLEGRAMDVGSGGGSPGLVFAVLRPGVRWKLLEPRRKRCLFLDEAIREVGLDNASVVRRRFEPSGEERDLAAISTRGVRLTPSDLEAIVSSLGPGGRFLWFSSAARLAEGAKAFSRPEGLRIEGPRSLLPGSGSFLLVVEKPPG